MESHHGTTCWNFSELDTTALDINRSEGFYTDSDSFFRPIFNNIRLFQNQDENVSRQFRFAGDLSILLAYQRCRSTTGLYMLPALAEIICSQGKLKQSLAFYDSESDIAWFRDSAVPRLPSSATSRQEVTFPFLILRVSYGYIVHPNLRKLKCTN